MQLHAATTVFLCGAALLGCSAADAWNEPFTRHDVGRDRGWTGGDGAVSIPLPGAPARTLWVFGDSLLTGYDPGTGARVGGRLQNAVFGNTIAVQQRADERDVRFYARKSTWTCSGTPEGAEACAVSDVTRGLDSDPNQGYRQLLDHRMFGLSAAAAENRLLWPSGGGLCLDCANSRADDDRLLIGLAELAFCTPQPDDPGCLTMCGVTGGTTTGVCTSGIRPYASVVARIDNPHAAPSAWRGAALRASVDVQWGEAIVQEGGQLYIYGKKRATDGEIAVARVARERVLEQTAWSYLAEGGQFVARPTQPPNASLRAAARGVGWFSVSPVTRRGLTRHVLLSDSGFDHLLYVRVGSSPFAFPALGADTPRLDLASIDPTLEAIVSARRAAGTCRPGAAGDYRSCGVSYHHLAHPHLSLRDAEGISWLRFGYIVPAGPSPDEEPPMAYYRPRFSAIPLDALAPWCTAAKTPCWTGAVRYARDQQVVPLPD